MQTANLSLNAQEPLRAELLRVVDALIDSATDSMGQMATQESLHQLRTTIKRLRALLRLIRPAIPELFDRENARLKAAARRLGFTRDTDVGRETLQTLPVSDSTEKAAVAAALAGFNSSHPPSQDLDQSIAGVRMDLQLTRRNLHRWKFRGNERELVETGLRAVYRQGRKRMHIACKQGQDEAFHRWRIRAKNLYYELQFLESVWPNRLHRMISHLAQLQEELGLDHDISVLRSRLQKNPDAFGGTEAIKRVLRCLDNESRKHRCVSIPLGRKIWAEKPRRFVDKVGKHWRKP